jgi:ParB family transcriptional regulator, chromosome partitioning protein
MRSKQVKRGLGRNRLDVLLSKPVTLEAAAAVAEAADGQLRDIPVGDIEPGRYQPRQHFDEVALAELAESIKTQGVIQPIIVRPISDSRYEIIAGERRWRAAKLAECETISAIVKDLPDETAIAIALIENIQREDLNVLEEAKALDRLQTEFSMTQQEVADAVGKSRSQVANFLRLLTLAHSVQEMLVKGQLEMGHAKVLLGLETSMQAQAAKVIVLRGMTVRETEDFVKRAMSAGQVSPQQARPTEDTALLDLEASFARRFGMKVKLKPGAAGKGKLVVTYQNLDALKVLLSELS